MEDWNCSSRIFPRSRDLKQLQVSWESQAPHPCPHLPSPGPAHRPRPRPAPPLRLWPSPPGPPSASSADRPPHLRPSGHHPGPASPLAVAFASACPFPWPPPLSLRTCSLSRAALTWLLSPPQVWERPVALEAEVALTLSVLGSLANSSLHSSLDQPLHTLRHIHAQLQACVSARRGGGGPGLGWALTTRVSPRPRPGLTPPHHPPLPTGPSSAHGRPPAPGPPPPLAAPAPGGPEEGE